MTCKFRQSKSQNTHWKANALDKSECHKYFDIWSKRREGTGNAGHYKAETKYGMTTNTKNM
jgi:hypothetical protein